MSSRRRRATHAGSWYDSSSERLRSSLSDWLQRANQHSLPPSDATVHAVIAPHAGYSYSGSTAAHAYAAVNPRRFTRVIVLGPSHHVFLKDRCAVSQAHALETPLGELPVDRDVVEGLLELGDRHAQFVPMDIHMDEAEHSIEMHLPYIRHVFAGVDVKVVPIVVGSLSEEKERHFGRVFADWLGDGETFFVISSDFCHWGSRFRYQPVDADAQCIWQGIERLDREAMTIIESGDHSAYSRYQLRTENTICGRHAIAILMIALAYCTASTGRVFTSRFVRYKQSSRCVKMSDSSVSYASAHIQTGPDVNGTPERVGAGNGGISGGVGGGEGAGNVTGAAVAAATAGHSHLRRN